MDIEIPETILAEEDEQPQCEKEKDRVPFNPIINNIDGGEAMYKVEKVFENINKEHDELRIESRNIELVVNTSVNNVEQVYN